MLRTRWTPSPCGRLSRPRTTTGPPPHPGGIGRRRTFPPTSRLLAGEGTDEMVPTFTLEPLDGVGAQLCPCNLATATPQSFTVASRPATSPDHGVPRTAQPRGYALLPSPDPPGSSWWFRLEERSAAGSSRTPFRLACRTRTIWQCWPARRCQGCFPPSAASPASGCPQLQWLAATSPRRRPFTTARFKSTSWRSMSATHSRSGAGGVNCRPTRSGAGVAAGSRRVSPADGAGGRPRCQQCASAWPPACDRPARRARGAARRGLVGRRRCHGCEHEPRGSAR
jgi:hypothetical protein